MSCPTPREQYEMLKGPLGRDLLDSLFHRWDAQQRIGHIVSAFVTFSDHAGVEVNPVILSLMPKNSRSRKLRGHKPSKVQR